MSLTYLAPLQDKFSSGAIELKKQAQRQEILLQLTSVELMYFTNGDDPPHSHVNCT